MNVTPETVERTRDYLHDRGPIVVPILNDTRVRLGELFETDVDAITIDQYRAEVDTVFADGERAVNITGYVGLLHDLDVKDDYPGFVVDEVLGRELAATIAGGQPLSVLAQATFHFADIHIGRDRDDTENAGVDDLDAALAAGFQTRLPGWSWREGPSPFAIDPRGDGP